MLRLVVILDPDAVSREALEKLLETEGYAGFCSVTAPEKAAREGKEVYLWVGAKGESVPKGYGINENQRFTKPVRAGEILERVRAYASQDIGKEVMISIGPYTLNPFSNELTRGKSGAKIRLTEKEGRILALLAESSGRVIDREELLRAVWGYTAGLETHTLETHIYRLRRKIERDPSKPEILLTDEAGYRINI